tara:strand:+ start:3464 stop:4495 length:1032 start_codon:yes stop_codon:yes gene_type:complete
MTLIKVKSRGTDNLTSRRNLLINGSMRVAQRATQVTGITSGGYKTCDRWYVQEGADATITSNQSTTVPRNEGFQNSLHMDVTNADTSLSSTQYASFVQFIEGKNLQHLKWGTSNAEPLTLSFWVYTNKTGTYSAVLGRSDATNNYQSQTYTVSAANTWEKKIITFIGDTTTVNTDDETNGLAVEFGLASGTGYTSGGASGQAWTNDVTKYFGGLNVNILDHADNNFYLTGVQLEVGNSVSDFQHLSYAEELELCKRYFFKAKFAHSAYATTSVYAEKYMYYPTQMRATPTITITGGTASNVGGQSVRYNVSGGFAHNIGPSSNGMCYIGGASNACDITMASEL